MLTAAIWLAWLGLGWQANVMEQRRSRLAPWAVVAAATCSTAAAISALMAERDALADRENDYAIRLDLMQFGMNQSDFKCREAKSRAEQAEAKLREIEALAAGGRERFVTEGPAVLMLKLESIATIVRSINQGVEG